MLTVLHAVLNPSNVLIHLVLSIILLDQFISEETEVWVATSLKSLNL